MPEDDFEKELLRRIFAGEIKVEHGGNKSDILISPAPKSGGGSRITM